MQIFALNGRALKKDTRCEPLTSRSNFTHRDEISGKFRSLFDQWYIRSEVENKAWTKVVWMEYISNRWTSGIVYLAFQEFLALVPVFLPFLLQRQFTTSNRYHCSGSQPMWLRALTKQFIFSKPIIFLWKGDNSPHQMKKKNKKREIKKKENGKFTCIHASEVTLRTGPGVNPYSVQIIWVEWLCYNLWLDLSNLSMV